MTNNLSIRLSESIVTFAIYYTPFILAFGAIGWYLTDKDSILLSALIMGSLYWFFGLFPLKDVKLDGNHLLIYNCFKKDKVHLNDIESLTTGSWSLYLTRIHFKRQTKFGQTIVFPTRQKDLGIGISDRVKNIFTQIQDNIVIQKANLIDKCEGHVYWEIAKPRSQPAEKVI